MPEMRWTLLAFGLLLLALGAPAEARPKHKSAIAAPPWTCESAAIAGRLDSLEQATQHAEMIEAVAPLGGCDHTAWEPALRSRVSQIDTGRYCEGLEAAQPLAAATCFRAWVRHHESARNADQARYAEAVAWENAKREAAACDAYRLLVEAHPDSPFTKRGLLRLAKLEDSLGHSAPAAESYEVYALRYPGEADLSAVLARAAELRHQLGDCVRVRSSVAAYAAVRHKRDEDTAVIEHARLACLPSTRRR